MVDGLMNKNITLEPTFGLQAKENSMLETLNSTKRMVMANYFIATVIDIEDV
jgi:hypothetical protein